MEVKVEVGGAEVGVAEDGEGRAVGFTGLGEEDIGVCTFGSGNVLVGSRLEG